MLDIKSPRFPEQLKAARVAAGLTQAQLANLANIDPSNISKYENREHVQHCRPRYETLAAINKALAELPDTRPSSGPVDERPASQGLLLTDASVEQLVAELKKRGVSSVAINW